MLTNPAFVINSLICQQQVSIGNASLLIALTILFNNHKQLAGNGVLTTLKGCYVQLIALSGIGKGHYRLLEESVPSIDALW